MKRNYFLVIGLISAFLSCNKENEPTLVNQFRLNDTIKIAFGDSLFNSDEKIYIAFNSVLEDSRCPMNANCIWAGTAIVDFHISASNITVPFELATNEVNNYSSDMIIDDFEIKLLGLYPYPKIGVESSNEDYLATIVLSKR